MDSRRACYKISAAPRILNGHSNLSSEKASKTFQKNGGKLRTDHWPEVAGRSFRKILESSSPIMKKRGNYLNVSPEFNPTGDKIAFLSDRNGYKEILLMRCF